MCVCVCVRSSSQSSSKSSNREKDTLNRFWRREFEDSRSSTICEWEWSTRRLRSCSCEDARSLRSDIVLKLEIFRENDLKRSAATLFFAVLVFSGDENLLTLLLIFLLKIADFGESVAEGGVNGGVSRSSAAEDRRVRSPFFPIFLAQFRFQAPNRYSLILREYLYANTFPSLLFIYFQIVANPAITTL